MSTKKKESSYEVIIQKIIGLVGILSMVWLSVLAMWRVWSFTICLILTIVAILVTILGINVMFFSSEEDSTKENK